VLFGNAVDALAKQKQPLSSNTKNFTSTEKCIGGIAFKNCDRVSDQTLRKTLAGNLSSAHEGLSPSASRFHNCDCRGLHFDLGHGRSTDFEASS